MTMFRLPWDTTQRVPSIIRDKNTSHIITSDAEYTVVYGVHIFSTHPELIPHNTSAVVLETGAVQWSRDPETAIDYLRQHVQYQELFKRMERDHTSVLFADLNYKFFPLLIPLLDMLLLETEVNIGTRLLKNSYKTMRKKNKSAGDMLKAAAGTIGGLWLVSSMASEMGRVGSMLTGIGQDETAKLQKFSSRMHPELFVLIKKLRDTIIGYKMQQFANSQRHNQVAAIVGGSHTGLEDQLISDQASKIEYLTKLKPIIQKLVVPESFYQLAQFDFRGNHWRLTKMHTFPELENIIATN